MENNELLQAMQAMMKEEISGLRQEMSANNKALSQMMDEKLEAVKVEVEAVKAEVGRVEHELTILIEDNHTDIFNFLREDYSRIEGNAAKGAEVAESYGETQSTQADHTRAIQQHHERITVLEEKAI